MMPVCVRWWFACQSQPVSSSPTTTKEGTTKTDLLPRSGLTRDRGKHHLPPRERSVAILAHARERLLLLDRDRLRARVGRVVQPFAGTTPAESAEVAGWRELGLLETH